ncbi:MAG: phosphotransferase [Rikenellaceae bacterium]
MGKFLKFSNADGKEWIVPTKNMRTALAIYQPSTKNGKLLKYLLPYLYWLPIIKKIIKGKTVEISLGRDVSELIKRVLKVEDFEFSIFEGTPSVHQKRVIQIWHKSKILAYCKISDNSKVVELLKNEQKSLYMLSSKGVKNIPTCYYCGRVSHDSNEVVFIQSTTKTIHSNTSHKFTQKHYDFLTQLHQKTKQKLLFEDSDLSKSLCRLEKYLNSFQKSDAQIIKRAIEREREYYGGKEVEFSAYHGDFTPWNSYFEKGELYVFDFEYCSSSYPAYMDWFHFNIQNIIYRQPKMLRNLNQNNCFEDLDIIYLVYIIDIISRYIDRDASKETINKVLSGYLKILRNL